MGYIKYNVYSGMTTAKKKISAGITGLIAVAFSAVMVLSSGVATAAVSNSYSLFGNGAVVSGGNPGNAAQIGNTTPGYGGVDYSGTGVTTFSQLNQLSSDYKFTQGSCGSGSPRFGAHLINGTTDGYIFFYVGPPPSYTGCPLNVWANTGNLAAPTNLIDTTQLPGGTFYDPYSVAQTKFGAYTVDDIFVVSDLSFASVQTLLVDNTQINSTTYTFDQPQGKVACKNGGWQDLTDNNGNHFKNQGDCVSFFATKSKNLAHGQ